MGVDSLTQQNGSTQAVNPRKRPAPSPDEDDDEMAIDKLLPAAAAMKRRRLEEAEENHRSGILNEQSFEASQKVPEGEKAKTAKKELKIKDVVRERREAEEEAAKQDEENLRETLEGMTVEEMKNLVVVEVMELPDRARRPQRNEPNGTANSRWDDRWNGRKNFKKFCRRGGATPARRGQAVIVPLEEAKKKDYGIGEDYWLETEKTKKKRRDRDHVSQSQSQSQALATAKSEPIEVPFELTVDSGLPAPIDLKTPRTTRRQERTQQTEDSSTRSQVVGGKRQASSDSNGVPAKKQRRFAVQDSDSDSDDELKFRFKNKGR